MSDAEKDTNVVITDDLTGLTGLGPVRRRLLGEAGITTRSQLAAASIDQIVSVTGMPRSAAEQILAQLPTVSVQTAEEPTTPEPVATESADEPVGELFVEPVVESEVAPSAEPLGDDGPQDSRLERAVLRAQTVIADASRRAHPKSRLEAMLPRFARLLDSLPRRLSSAVRPAVTRRIAERVEAITERLERLTAKATGTAKKGAAKKPALLSAKREKRLSQRLKRTRDSIKRTLKNSSANPKPAGTKDASGG